MRIGLDHYTIAHRNLAPLAALDFIRGLGLDGVQFLEPSALSPTLDPGELDAIRVGADRLGLYLEVGIPSPNPTRASRALGREVTAEEHAERLRPELDAAARLGVRHVRAYLGDRHDRFRSNPPWRDQLAASADVIRRLEPTLREHSLRIAIETHADVTVAELERLLDEIGADLLGVTLDTGNLLMRLEDPLAAARRLAPHVICTHLKDAVLEKSPRGYRWQARPIGSGIVPIPEIIDVLARQRPDLNLSIELHPRTYDLPTLDPSWLAFFPDLAPGALAAVEDFAARCEALYIEEGGMPRPEVVEAIPWTERDLDWIGRSVAYLRELFRARGYSSSNCSPA